MRGWVAGSFALSIVLAAPALADTTLNALFMKQAAYSDSDIQAMTAEFEAAHPGLHVNLELVPFEALHDKIVAANGAGADGYDVVLFDVTWPAEFSRNGFLKDVTERIAPDLAGQIFDGAWSTVTAGGRRWGMPWILDTKYLFYNKAMLAKAGIASPPKTWAELAEDAKKLKDQGVVQYPIVWSWSQAEALIVDYSALVAGYGGGFTENGKFVFDHGAPLEALNYMKSTLDSGVTNPHSTEYLEEDVRKVFSNGDAAFALNWTFMYGLANDPKESRVVGQIGVVPAPGVEGKSSVTAPNGSMGLGIAAHSAHPDEAWRYIEYLTSRPVQDKYAKLSLPIWKASYDDPAIAKGQEDLVAAARLALPVLSARPAAVSYQELSAILQKALQQALLGEATPEAALQHATQSAARLR